MYHYFDKVKNRTIKIISSESTIDISNFHPLKNSIYSDIMTDFRKIESRIRTGVLDKKIDPTFLQGAIDTAIFISTSYR